MLIVDMLLTIAAIEKNEQNKMEVLIITLTSKYNFCFLQIF